MPPELSRCPWGAASWLRHGLGLCALLSALAAGAQDIKPLNQVWREAPVFQEAEVTLPTTLRTTDLIAVPYPGSELRIGVDPQSLSIGADGVMRYVMVARSASGTLNAAYEGVRCDTGEVKVYARHYPDSGWKAVTSPAWQSLLAGAAQRHALAIARNGLCNTDGRKRSVAEVLRDLRTGSGTRYDF